MDNPELTDSAPEQSRIEAFLAAYTPKTLSAGQWRQVAAEAIALVLRGRPATVERARKGIEALAAAATYLSHTSVPLTVENLVSDATLAGLDAERLAAGAAERTRENLRGRLRRLRATLEGVPARGTHRPEGDRIARLPTAEQGQRVLELLGDDNQSDTAGSAALRAAVDAARSRRRVDGTPTQLPKDVWDCACAFAASRDVPVSRRALDVLATYEVLARPIPLGQLVAAYGLTRRDLDLALTTMMSLPEVHDDAHRELLRGLA